MQLPTRSFCALVTGLAFVATPSPVTQGQGTTAQGERHVDAPVFGAHADLDSADKAVIGEITIGLTL